MSVKLIEPLDGVNVLATYVSDGLDLSRALQSTSDLDKKHAHFCEAPARREQARKRRRARVTTLLYA